MKSKNFGLVISDEGDDYDSTENDQKSLMPPPSWIPEPKTLKNEVGVRFQEVYNRGSAQTCSEKFKQSIFFMGNFFSEKGK